LGKVANPRSMIRPFHRYPPGSQPNRIFGLRSIAVPVRDRGGHVIAAMNIGVHASRVSPDEMVQRFLPILRESSRNLSQLLV
jgi:DNA-binding IclR family transcriptional regulator